MVTAEDGALTPSGAEIAELIEGASPAGDAGFLPGDAIVEVEGADIRTMEDLVIALRLFHVGEEVEVTVTREDSPITATVLLIERPDDPPPLTNEEGTAEVPGDE